MKRRNGFSLLELMVSLSILLVVAGAAITALVQAEHVTQGVGLLANTQENLRAGMNFMVRDLAQAGAGMPQAGIPIPTNSGGASSLKRPGTGTTVATMTTFPTTWTTLPLVSPGSQAGQAATTLNPSTGAVLTSGNTDIINILYADTTTAADTNGHYLNSFPVVDSGAQTCSGTFTANGSSVTIDRNCFIFPTSGPTQFVVGDLIMFTNSNGSALQYVTGVNTGTQTLSFAAGDPAGLNGTGYTSGTVVAMQNFSGSPSAPNGTLPTPTIERVYMVTYYVDATTNPSSPQLVRQVNYPIATASQAIADAIEDLGFTYDITSPQATYGSNGAGDAPAPISPDTAAQIRAVNVFLAARSETTYNPSSSPQFFRNNLTTQVCLRSLAFQAPFSTSAGVPPIP
jgi:prepilin-type N-terminal cleavage/methylation domain-containing protein